MMHDMDSLTIANKKFSSRLLLGTGKYKSSPILLDALDAASAEIVTVAIRRIELDQDPSDNILDAINPNQYLILANTAGARTAEEAITIARLAKAMGLPNWIKVEVTPDPKWLFPDPKGTLEAAETLVKEGFIVLPYINADPVLARQLEEVGCSTVMPLGSAIGSGQGIHTLEEIQIIIQTVSVPVIVDAGLGVPSDACLAMEVGADAVLVNTAIAKSYQPKIMAEAFKAGVIAGRLGFLSGRMEKTLYANPSSPTEGKINYSG
tara:strand:- start:2476 stop:3267 length:792 start_codon:yes stop_codon:yes gene_type:complete